MEYQVRLPDHGFVKGRKHKLIPSVRAACQIKPKPAKKDPDHTQVECKYAYEA